MATANPNLIARVTDGARGLFRGAARSGSGPLRCPTMTDAGRPIAWMALDKGTPVYSSDGEEIGKVATVVADVQKDIFSGISFKHGLLGSEHFVPADAIGELTDQAVHLNLSADQAQALQDHSG
jgi:hypothetical protein